MNENGQGNLPDPSALDLEAQSYLEDWPEEPRRWMITFANPANTNFRDRLAQCLVAEAAVLREDTLAGPPTLRYTGLPQMLRHLGRTWSMQVPRTVRGAPHVPATAPAHRVVKGICTKYRLIKRPVLNRQSHDSVPMPCLGARGTRDGHPLGRTDSDSKTVSAHPALPEAMGRP